METVTGVLVLAATPIGHVADASSRLSHELANADVIAAEDTRRLRHLCTDLGIRPQGLVVSYYDGNESTRTPLLIDALQSGERVLLVSDGGMPSVSDPGYRLVQAAVASGITVTAVPGPSAVPTALAVSGLPVDRWCFEGFLPRKDGERTKRLKKLADEERTMVFFEAPHRASATLEALAEAFGGERPAVGCRELTKTHEEVKRGSLSELVKWAEPGLRGELTIVVGGNALVPRPRPKPDELRAAVSDLENGGRSRKDAIVDVAESAGVPKREVYDAVHRDA